MTTRAAKLSEQELIEQGFIHTWNGGPGVRVYRKVEGNCELLATVEPGGVLGPVSYPLGSQWSPLDLQRQDV
jgi:hypothetical protein